MSKSLGNVISPQQIIDRLGTDGLRLWVASVGHDGDIAVSERLLENVAQVYRKIRNTSRFLLQNLYDFNPKHDLLVPDELLFVDRLALYSFIEFCQRVEQAYASYNSTAVFHACADYCTTQLSALYLDMVKDRLYVEAAHSRERRSVQTVLWYMLDGLTRLLAPVLSFTAEQIADHYQHPWAGSVHMQQFADLSMLEMGEHEKAIQWWNLLVELRSLVMKLLEEQRGTGLIKHSLQATVTLHITAAYTRFEELEACKVAINQSGSSLERVLQDLCVVSSLRILQDCREQASETHVAGIYGNVQHAPGSKCARCWQWHLNISKHELCDRCEQIVMKK